LFKETSDQKAAPHYQMLDYKIFLWKRKFPRENLSPQDFVTYAIIW